MNGNVLNVLSIDWDYFINASYGERLVLFPDGGNENLNYELQDMIWIGRYLDKRLKRIRADTKSLNTLKKCLKTSVKSGNVRFQIVDSHKHAYDFITNTFTNGKYVGVNLVNVDFHHDIYNIKESSPVDCGNWFSKIMRETLCGSSTYTWVARQDSDIDIDKHYSKDLNILYEDLSILNKYDWDLIFICRSGMWSPPHLDSKFAECFQDLLNSSCEVLYQKGIFDTRYNKEFQSKLNSQLELQNLIDKQWCGL